MDLNFHSKEAAEEFNNRLKEDALKRGIFIVDDYKPQGERIIKKLQEHSLDHHTKNALFKKDLKNMSYDERREIGWVKPKKEQHE